MGGVGCKAEVEIAHALRCGSDLAQLGPAGGTVSVQAGGGGVCGGIGE